MANRFNALQEANENHSANQINAQQIKGSMQQQKIKLKNINHSRANKNDLKIAQKALNEAYLEEQTVHLKSKCNII